MGMAPQDPARRRLLIGLAGVAGLGAVGGLAWLLGDDEAGVQAAGTTPSTSTSRAPSTAAAPTTTTTAAPPSTTTTTAAPTTTTTTTLPAATVSAICREAWGAQPPTGEFTEHTIERITVHHTAAVIEDNRLAPAITRKHQADHQGIGWPDLAYHFVIDRNGHIYEGRPYTAVGDTRTSYDPTGHLLIAVKGNFEEQELTGPQLASLIAMLAWGVGEFEVPPTGDHRPPRLGGHCVSGREPLRTDCERRTGGSRRPGGHQRPDCPRGPLRHSGGRPRGRHRSGTGVGAPAISVTVTSPCHVGDVSCCVESTTTTRANRPGTSPSPVVASLAIGAIFATRPSVAFSRPKATLTISPTASSPPSTSAAFTSRPTGASCRSLNGPWTSTRTASETEAPFLSAAVVSFP